ncbi:MAG: hypothetical protein OXD31_03920, partial [Chloroflexi bacterium]|nr:hypothetical protein [Chloroflexota bacterium]
MTLSSLWGKIQASSGDAPPNLNMYESWDRAVTNKIRGLLEQGSWIRRMFEEGIELKRQFGEENVFDLSLGN